MSAGTVLVTAALALGLAAAVGAEPMQRLAGTVPRALAEMSSVGAAPTDMPLEAVTVFLGLRDHRHLDALIAAQQDRHTPFFQHWLEPTELAERFGPRRVDYERVRSWFRAQGFRVVRDSPYRLSLVVAGTAGQVETALATPIHLFRRRDRTYHGPLVDPALPASVAAIVRGLLGLDDLPRFRPLARLAKGQVALAPADFAAVYDVTPLQAAGLTGAGHSIAVIARSNFHDSDVAAFAARFVHPPQIDYTRKLVDVSRDPGILPDAGEEAEVLLDTEWAGALAPGARVNVVISPPPDQGDIPEALDKAVRDREGDIITISFSLCEARASVGTTEMFDSLYALANAQGQTVLVAAGDNGASDCAPVSRTRLAVNVLASSPHAIAVGGTSFALAADGTVGATIDEEVWNDRYGAGGGGRSFRFARPLYQLAAGLTTAGRALPDLALAASPRSPGYVIVEGGANHIIGGTSASAPAFASVLALVNQRLAAAHGATGLGQLLPALYRLGSEQARGLRTPVFRDVTQGDNAFENATGFAAGPGFDLATGWGAPLAASLADALGGPGRCEPELACLVPAAGPRRHACAAEWLVERQVAADERILPHGSFTCRDGDPQCDLDGAVDGRCTVNVALCLNVLDSRPAMLDRRGAPACTPGGVRAVQLLAPRANLAGDGRPRNRRALLTAFAGLPELPTNLRTACTPTTPVVVAVRPAEARPGVRLRARVVRPGGTTVARLRLRCAAS